VSAVAETMTRSRIDAIGYDYGARSKEWIADCNLCGSTRHVELGNRDRYGFDAQLQLCARCGLAFISPRLTADEYRAFYQSYYRPLVSAFKGGPVDWETLQSDQRIYARELGDFLAPRLGVAPASILDVGGSTGVVAAELCEELGSTATVLDPAPEDLRVAQEAGMETVEGVIEEFEPDGRQWDLVLVCQTIDHLLDVRGALERVKSMVAPGGHVYVDVVDLLFAMRRAGSLEGAVKIDHPHYLTRATSIAFFESVGLDIVSERVSHDAHLLGFLLRPGSPGEPDWGSLGRSAEAIMDDVSRARAAGS